MAIEIVVYNQKSWDLVEVNGKHLPSGSLLQKALEHDYRNSTFSHYSNNMVDLSRGYMISLPWEFNAQ